MSQVNPEKRSRVANIGYEFKYIQSRKSNI